MQSQHRPKRYPSTSHRRKGNNSGEFYDNCGNNRSPTPERQMACGASEAGQFEENQVNCYRGRFFALRIGFRNMPVTALDKTEYEKARNIDPYRRQIATHVYL